MCFYANRFKVTLKTLEFIEWTIDSWILKMPLKKSINVILIHYPRDIIISWRGPSTKGRECHWHVLWEESLFYWKQILEEQPLSNINANKCVLGKLIFWNFRATLFVVCDSQDCLLFCHMYCDFLKL